MSYVKQVYAKVPVNHDCGTSRPHKQGNTDKAPIGDAPGSIWRCDVCGGYSQVSENGWWYEYKPNFIQALRLSLRHRAIRKSESA